MFFSRSKKRNPPPGGGRSPNSGQHAEMFHITYEMMLKGSYYKRRGKPIRQCGVTVDGSTKLVTSGDVVDRATYDALVAAGVIRPQPTTPPASPGGPPSTDPHRRPPEGGASE